MEKELFEMTFELIDIESANDTGYKNMYDITVSGDHTFLLGNGVVSHNSALGGLSPVLGRKECGYYVLKGKPLNSYSAQQSKFTANKELSELYKVIMNGAEFENEKEGDWFKIEIENKTYIVNENDILEIDGKKIVVKKLIN